MEKLIPVVEMRRPDADGCCIWRIADFSAEQEFDGSEDGDKIELTLKFMTEDDVANLPEFEGW